MKRAALYLSGHLRHYEASRPKLDCLFQAFKDCHVDLYLATWRDRDTADGPKGVERKQLCVGQVDENALIQFYQPVDYHISDYEVWRPEFHWSKFMAAKPSGHPSQYYIVNDVLICAPQLYLFWRAHTLVKDQYDIVIRARPDFLPTKPFAIRESQTLTFPIVYQENGRPHALDDRFCYGPAAKMGVFAALWPHLRHVIESYDPAKFPYLANENHCQHLSCERVMHRWCVENGVSFGEDRGVELARVT